MIRGLLRAPAQLRAPSPTRRYASVLLAWCAAGVAAHAGVTLTPHNGVRSLTAPARPQFTINAFLDNPSTVTDANGVSYTDFATQIRIGCTRYGFQHVIAAPSYQGSWTEHPSFALPAGEWTYTVHVYGTHYDAYAYWIPGHNEDFGFWEWSEDEGQDVWIEDWRWVEGYWDTGARESFQSLRSATVTFWVSHVHAQTTLTPFNGSINLASPAQPKFTIGSNVTVGRTVHDAFGNSRTDRISHYRIHNATYGWFPDVIVGATSYNGLWTDPRSNLGNGTQTYTVRPYVTYYEAYDNGWVEGHWEEHGYWTTNAEGEEEWVDQSRWVDTYRDTGFDEYLEPLEPQVITFVITTGTPQTITFPQPPDRSHGTPPFTISATASSGLPVSFRIASGPATASGSTISLTGTGQVTVVAEQWGNATYSSAPAVSRTFTVTAGQPQTISFPALASRTFGDAPFPVSATASSGLPVTFAVTAGPATISGSTVTLNGAGTVTITASQSGSAIWGPAPNVAQSFTVAKAAQTINFAPISNKIDGDAPFTIGAVASSFLPVTFSVVSGPATVAGNTLTVTGPGAVTVRASQSGDTRYLAAPNVDQTFNVSLGPNGHALTVINGTANGIGGNQGREIGVQASIPPGQYFTGWTIVAGNGSFMDVASPNTAFFMGTMATTIRANYSATAPTYGLAWTEVNVPASLTVGSSGYTFPEFAGIVTNTGTAPWSRYTIIEIRDAYDQLVGFGSWIHGVTGVAPGERAAVSFTLTMPSALGTKGFAFRAIDNATFPGRVLGSVLVRHITLTSRAGTPPNASTTLTRTTVSTPVNASVQAENGPTNFAVVGGLPPGLTLNPSTGVFSGTPTAAGDYAATVSVANSAGNDWAGAFFRVYPNFSYALTVSAGTSPSSSLNVGASAALTANPPPAGQIFNGWTVLSGAGSFVSSRHPETSVRLDGPGNLSVRANLITGNPLNVVNGTSTPLGGAPGADIALTPDPDRDGTMFSAWSTQGPGSVTNPSSLEAIFTMGNGPATVTANFVPGYRLTVIRGTANAPGGLPGTQIAIWPGASPGPGYTFEGWWLDGPGYIPGDPLYANAITMGTGPARINAGWWPSNSGPITRTLLWAPEHSYNFYKNEAFTMRAATHFGPPRTNDAMPPYVLTGQQIDYSTDGGNTWLLGARWENTPPASQPVRNENYPWRFEYRRPGGFPTAGTVVFRARAFAANLDNPIYAYMPVRILNVDAATFVSYPSSLTVVAGQLAIFTCSAVGDGGRGTVQYEWRKDNVPIPGQSGTVESNDPITLRIDAALPSDAGVYTVAIRSGLAGNWLVSESATLTVRCVPPTIVNQPTAITTVPGATAQFRVTPVGAEPFTFQWNRNNVAIPGATSATLTFTNVQAADAASYTVLVSNVCGSITSQAAALTVNVNAPTIAAQPASLTVFLGQTAQFSVVPGGSGYAFQWRKDGTSISGATQTSLSISNSQLTDEAFYTVVLSNSAGSVTSDQATLTVTTPDPDGDIDGDGIRNGVEMRLGSNPSVPTAIDATNQASLKVHKP